MSKQNNANWDRYKVAGREHSGDEVHHERERQQFSGAKQAGQAGPHIPNQERASQPRGVDQEAADGSDEGRGADPQNISGTDDVEPILSDDEGYTG